MRRFQLPQRFQPREARHCLTFTMFRGMIGQMGREFLRVFKGLFLEDLRLLCAVVLGALLAVPFVRPDCILEFVGFFIVVPFFICFAALDFVATMRAMNRGT